MKKLILLTGVLAMTVLVSCKDKETDTTVETTTTETVVQETPAPPPPPPPVAEEQDGTSIQVGSDGVTLDTKDGTKKTTIDVRDGKAGVEIKK